MEFEWDPGKSKINQEKHGVSFETASSLWDKPYLEVPQIAYSQDKEQRGATLGIIGKDIYVAIWTKRKNKTRLISVRRAKKYEKEIYRKSFQNR